MYCDKCSTELPDDAVACYRCGTVTGATFVKPLYSREPVRVKEKVSVQNVIALTLLGVLTVAAVAYVAAYIFLNKNSNPTIEDNRAPISASNKSVTVPNKPSPTPNRETVANTVAPASNLAEPARNTAVPLTLPQASMPAANRPAINDPRSNTLFSGELVVKASGARWFGFVLGPDGGRVVGEFAADGGLRGEITCFIAPANEAENLGRGLQGRVYFNSGRVHVGNIDERLGPGEYVLMFRNESPWTQRIVNGKIMVTP